MVLATVNRETPHAVTLFFAHDDELNLYFVSHPKSAHCRHLMQSSAVAATVFSTPEMWQQVRGVQIRGQCNPVSLDDSTAVQELLFAKITGMSEIERHVRMCRFYKITPSRLRWIDNSVRFGHKVELHWPWPPTVVFNDYDGEFI